MTIPTMIAIVAAVSQLLKEWIPLEIKGRWAMLLTFVVSAGVVGYKFLAEHLPLEVAIFTALFVQVFVGSNVGYQFLKKFRAKT